MKCLSFADILEISQPAIAEMQRVGQAFPDDKTPVACRQFTNQVRQVEGAVRNNYAIAADLARKTESLAEIMAIWEAMGCFCQTALQALTGLKEKYPYCGAPELFDLLLDYKLACDKRFKNAAEELACQPTTFPQGLLPEMN